MISRYAGSCLGLFAFTVACASGLVAGNQFSTVLSRALLAMFLFFVIGSLLGYSAQKVVNEQVAAKEKEIEAAGAGGPISDASALEEETENL
jgi:hypothetical protein